MPKAMPAVEPPRGRHPHPHRENKWQVKSGEPPHEVCSQAAGFAEAPNSPEEGPPHDFQPQRD